MENKSRLPKPMFSSKLPTVEKIPAPAASIPLASSSIVPVLPATATKPAATASKVSKAPVTTNRFQPAFRLTRRSKSVSDLRTLTRNVKIDFKKPAINLTSKKPLRPITNATTTTASRGVATKRPAAKIDEDVKPKVPRQQKIPDWDYKSRFNLLNEKYKALNGELETKKAQLENLEELQKENVDISKNLENLSKKHKDLETLCAELTATLKDKTDEIQRLKVTELEYQDLLTRHDELKCDYDNLTQESTKNEAERERLASELRTKTEEYDDLLKENDFLKNTIVEQELLRRTLHNTIQDLKGNIRVFCRVRPAIDSESDTNYSEIGYVGECGMRIRKSGAAETEFAFDRVFQPTAKQTEVFEELALLIQSALDGYNVCVFAYGQTGSGKTYTMQGMDTTEELGLIPRAVDLIFQSIENLRKSNWTYDISASFLEIYNETICDLLQPDSATTQPEICFNDGRGTSVNNLTIKRIESAAELKKVMKTALDNRRVAATNFNERSSRSHAVSTIYIEGRNESHGICYRSSINLVDLAGSESAKTTTKERLAETKYINKSLSALGNVMLALHQKKKHIPYRDSKLTFLLQSSLGGNSKTLMIANVSPFECNYNETMSTLRFASKVNEVVMTSKKNRAVLSPNNRAQL